jgi:hypothetical protein
MGIPSGDNGTVAIAPVGYDAKGGLNGGTVVDVLLLPVNKKLLLWVTPT